MTSHKPLTKEERDELRKYYGASVQAVLDDLDAKDAEIEWQKQVVDASRANQADMLARLDTAESERDEARAELASLQAAYENRCKRSTEYAVDLAKLRAVAEAAVVAIKHGDITDGENGANGFAFYTKHVDVIYDALRAAGYLKEVP